MQGFGRIQSTRIASAALLVGVLGGACASSHGAEDGGKTLAPICPDCVTTAGGQTSDFGSGGGCGDAVVTPVDVDTARAQGLTVVDQVDRSFDAPLVWTGAQSRLQERFRMHEVDTSLLEPPREPVA
jgi:hypothetical protein